LDFPREFFFQQEEQNVKIGNSYFRALLATTKQEKSFQMTRIKVLSKIYHYLAQYIDFPKLNMLDIETEFKDIEEISKELRQYWGIGNNPISNIVNLIEKNGVIITAFTTQEYKIDAFTQTQVYGDNKYCFVVLGDDKASGARRQFSAAHELGHIILHENSMDTEEIDKDEYKKMEQEANQFAASFLLPREAFLLDLVYPNKLDFYIELKKKWRVSISAMIMRAYQLEVININQYQYLMKQISYKGWKKIEPLDDVLPMPKPVVLSKAIDVLTDNKVLSEKDIMIGLKEFGIPLSKNEVEVLLGLSKGRLTKETGQGIVIELKDRQK